MAFTNIGCISAQVAFATQAWPAGSKTVGPVSIGNAYRHGELLIDVSGLTDLTSSISVTIDLSFDGGATFTTVGGWGLDLPTSGYTLPGGVLTDSNGDPVRVTSAALKFPQASSIQRQIRATATLTTPATVGCTVVIW
jgi:hypothetical protein